MTKTGRKFHTLHKFGKRKRKKKVAKDIVSTQPDSQVSVESSEGPTPSTSTTGASSASSRKLLFFKRKRQESDSEASDEEERGSDEPDLQGGSQNIAVIVDLNCLQSLILASGILCPHCNNQTLTVAEGGPKLWMGSACLLELCCSTCGSLSTQYSSTKSGTVRTGYDVNRRIVVSASACGMGFYQVRRFFAMMGLPAPMSESAWYDLKKRIYPVIKEGNHTQSEKAWTES